VLANPEQVNNLTLKTGFEKRVAIVDDLPGLRRLYELVLRQRGHKVVLVACSGEEVVKEAENGKLNDVDVLILDYLMEEVNGLQAAGIVLQRNPQVKIVIASGEDAIESQVRAAGLEYLKKPFGRDELLKCIG
jgi:DNA-binding NtrC family response regulator